MKLKNYPTTNRFYPTNYRNPCPLCSDISGDCRTTDGDLLLCHSYINSDSGLAGWKFRGVSSDGVWGNHVRDNGKELNREQYEKHQKLRKAQKRDEAAFLREHALDADGRDKAIRKIASRVGLSNRDRQSLKKRGLTDEMIANGLFFTIEPYKTYYFDLPDNLPGIKNVSGGGWQFATKDIGYACVIFDREGKAIGWQLRVRGVTEGNKYKWAKSNFSSKLPNGELPITFIKPDKPVESIKNTLYLSEGILKALVASDRHKISVSGASGGNFRNSPEQLAEIIKDCDKLVIVPDAGDVINTQVMLRWRRLVEHLKRFELPIYFLWWGQVSKREHQDIDEIDSATFAQAEYLKPKEFFELSEKQLYVKQKWDGWKTYKKFTPQVKIEKRFVEFGLPQKNTITFIKSGLGTGKTTQLIKLLDELTNQGIISLGYRNTLLLQFNEKAKHLGFYHLQSDKDLESFNLADPTINVSNCVDSLLHYQPEYFDGKIIVIDEIVSVLKHLLFSNTIRNFERVKDLFTEMVRRCDRLICLDGFMQDWAVKFLQELCPSKQIVTLENTYQGEKPQIYLLEGTLDIEENLRVNDRSPWLEKLLESDCPVICSDSQIFCESIEKILSERGRKGIRIDSKTVSEERVKDFFKNPARWIDERGPEYVIYSPSAESGLDIPTKNYFTEHFAFFFGVLDIDSCIQMLGRVRDAKVAKYVWCKQYIKSPESEQRISNIILLQAQRERLLMAELHSTLNSVESNESKLARLQQVYQDNLDPYTNAADTIKAIHNHEFGNYRECLKQQLIDNGYKVWAGIETIVLRNDEIIEREKQIKDEIKTQNSRDIYNAGDDYIGQNIRLKFDADWETRCQLKKAKLVGRLPEINKSQVWSPEFIRLVEYERPNSIKQNERFYLLENPDIAKELSLRKYNGIYNQGSIAAPWKLRQDYLFIQTLIDVGFDDLRRKAIAAPEYYFTAKSPEIKILVSKCKGKKYKDVLGHPGKDPIKFVKKLFAFVGLEVRSRQITKNGKQIRVYCLDRERLSSDERLAIQRAIKLKYEEKNDSPNQPLEWVEKDRENHAWNPKVENQQKIAETYSLQELQFKQITPNFLKKNNVDLLSQNPSNFLVDSTSKSSNTEQLQNSLDSEESIRDLRGMLEEIESAEELAELTTIAGFTRERLNRAARLLPRAIYARIKQWAISVRRQSRASSSG